MVLNPPPLWWEGDGTEIAAGIEEGLVGDTEESAKELNRNNHMVKIYSGAFKLGSLKIGP